MKAISMILIFTFALALHAQEPKHLDKAPANFMKALNSDSNQMAEAALFHMLKLKLFYPEIDTDLLTQKVEKVMQDGKTETFRYKAYVTHYFLSNPVLLDHVVKENYKNCNEFFQMLASVMQEQLLADQE